MSNESERPKFDINTTGVTVTPEGTLSEHEITADGCPIGEATIFSSSNPDVVSGGRDTGHSGAKGQRSFGMPGITNWNAPWTPAFDEKRAAMQTAAKQARNKNPNQN